MADAANTGYLFDALSKWFVALGALAGLGQLIEMLILAFRSLVRLTKIVGRSIGVAFPGDHGPKPDRSQIASDLASVTCFLLALILFSGILIPPPINFTVAWAVGLVGFAIVNYSDFKRPENKAQEKHERLLQQGSAQENIEAARIAFTQRRAEWRSHTATLIGLTLMLLCGTAALFAPPLLAPVLLFIAQAASIFIILVFLERPYRWALEQYEATHTKKSSATGGDNEPAAPRPSPMAALTTTPAASPTQPGATPSGKDSSTFERFFATLIYRFLTRGQVPSTLDSRSPSPPTLTT